LKALHEIQAASHDKKARVHLELDTGMTRGGFLGEWSEIDPSDVAGLEIVGVFSHFARADEPEQEQNAQQLARFTEMVATLEGFGFKNIIRHLSNSAATLKNPAAAFDMVRTGIALYGLTPDVALGSPKDFGLRPAMQVRSSLYLVKNVPAGTAVGYGASESTKSDTKLGVVTMGYGDGIPRIAKGAGVWINGERAPIIGRVSMDQFVVDLGASSKAQSGDWVVVFGNGSHGEYTADDWGAASGSINYEIVTRIGPRVPRIYSAHVY
jgi:alanine racemase